MPRKAVTHGACPSSFECCVAVAGRVATVDDGSTGSFTVTNTRVVGTMALLALLAGVGHMILYERSLFASWNGEEPHTQDQDERRIRDQLGDKTAEFWIYDDLSAARTESLRTKKPILVSLRCVP